MISALFLIAACYSTAVAGHGRVDSPPARAAGKAMKAACGADAVAAVDKDNTTFIEEVDKVAKSTCNPFLCRGAVFEDNKNVQSFNPGQVINFKVSLPIPHEGPANVSVVDTASDSIVGEMLLVFDTYADEKLAELPANNTDFNVTMPQLSPGKCTKAGECVLQWWWAGTEASSDGTDQTYASCVDFTVPSTRAAAKANSSEPASTDKAAKSVASSKPEGSEGSACASKS